MGKIGTELSLAGAMFHVKYTESYKGKGSAQILQKWPDAFASLLNPKPSTVNPTVRSRTV